MSETRHERYGFGRNWQSFLSHNFSQERADIARRWLLRFLGQERLTGLAFLDIGCGSGLHSLGAFQAGAERVVSLDLDPASVAATRDLHARYGHPPHWQVLEGSVLDAEFMAGLGRFDIVYSWGVLHHTGEQWRGIDQAARRVSEHGCFYLALYATEYFLDTDACLALKRRYHRAGSLGRVGMEAAYIWHNVCGRKPANLLRLPTLMRNYRHSRGMAALTDARDWLGGWPMEFSSVPEVCRALAAHGLVMVQVKTGQPNTEYLFMPEAHARARGRSVIRPEDLAAVRLPVLRSADALPEGAYYIFGTARGAGLLLAAAQRVGRMPAGFIDLEARGPLNRLPVFDIDDFVARLPPTTPVVLSNIYVQENAERLWRHGFTEVINGYPLVVAFATGMTR